MSGKKRWLRAIVVLLAFMLLPFGQFAGGEIPKAHAEDSKVQLNLYLFGADETTQPKLVYEEYVGESSVETSIYPSSHVPGNGYIKYEFLVDYFVYDLYINDEFQNYYLDPEDQLDYIYHVKTSNYEVEVFWYDISRNGTAISGWLTFDGPEEAYRLTILDPQGNFAAVCEEAYDEDHIGEIKVKEFEMDCSLPSNAGSLQIEARVSENEYAATNFRLMLGDIGTPKVISVIDENHEIERVELTVQFRNDSESASDIALYRITTDVPDYWASFRYVPAGTGGPYTVKLGETFVGLKDRIYIQPISSSGHVYLDTAIFPIVDDFEDIERINFNEFDCGIANHYYCVSNFNFDEGIYDPTNKKFKEGTIRWTLPDTGGKSIAAYDLYFVDGNKEFIEGEARVYLHPDQGTFDYTLPSIPELAEYVAAVTLLTEDFDDGYAQYYTEPFFISLTPPPPLDDSLLPPTLIRIEEGVYGYIPTGMKVMELRNELPDIWTEAWIEGPGGIMLGSDEPIVPGSKLILKSATGEYELELRMLSELLKQGDPDPITLKRIVEFVVSTREDVTGDGRFDSLDARRLIEELEA